MGLFTVTVGNATTVTVDTAVLLHPAALEPVTVYEVAPGVTLNGFAVEPVFHVYVDAPAAVKLTDEPVHTVGLFTVTVGNATTVTVDTAVLLHPAALEPVTVYEVAPGVTLKGFAVEPVFQV